MPKIIDDILYDHLVKYLASRPYNEVEGGMAELRRSPSTSDLYAALAECIRTGQVPQEDVPAILANDPAFEEFYKDSIRK